MVTGFAVPSRFIRRIKAIQFANAWQRRCHRSSTSRKMVTGFAVPSRFIRRINATQFGGAWQRCLSPFFNLVTETGASTKNPGLGMMCEADVRIVIDGLGRREQHDGRLGAGLLFGPPDQFLADAEALVG